MYLTKINSLPNSKKNRQQGFTLVEMSIVLVIIGLILGGVLVGQDLIRSAETRGTIALIEKFNTAVNAFRNKFGYLPGDHPSASNYITASGVTINNGDGNGLIATGQPGATPTAISTELAGIWAHLGAENLLDNPYTGTFTQTNVGDNFPALNSGRGGVIAYGHSDLRNYWHIGLTNSPAASTTIVTANNLSPNAALQIDTKTDDGVPVTGSVLARGGVVLEGAATSAGTLGTTTNCLFTTPTPDVYNSAASSALLCQLRILMM